MLTDLYKDMLHSPSLNGLQHIQIINKIINSIIYHKKDFLDLNNIDISLTDALQVRQIVNYDEKNKILDFLKSEIIHVNSNISTITASHIQTICLDLIKYILFDASQFQKLFEIIDLINNENNLIKNTFMHHLIHMENVPDEIKLFL